MHHLGNGETYSALGLQMENCEGYNNFGAAGTGGGYYEAGQQPPIPATHGHGHHPHHVQVPAQAHAHIHAHHNSAAIPGGVGVGPPPRISMDSPSMGDRLFRARHSETTEALQLGPLRSVVWRTPIARTSTFWATWPTILRRNTTNSVSSCRKYARGQCKYLLA